MANNTDTKVITGKVRFSYLNVFAPKAMDEGSEPKYSATLLIDKSDEKLLSVLNKAIENAKVAGKSKLADKKGNIPANIKLPLRDGDLDRPDDPAMAGKYFINCTSKLKPGIVDRNLDPILDQDEFYSGCYGRASINFYAFNVGMQKGIAAGLNNLQKLEEGERLAGGASAESDFGGENAFDEEDMF